MNKEMEERQFFEYLLEKSNKVFLISKTYSLYGDKNWNFAVCETPIRKKTGVFLGLNWGGDDVDTQTKYPETNKKRDWNFVSHSRRYFREYFNAEIEQLNYSNLCFFRSPEADRIHRNDWELAIPLFKEYIDYIKPPWTLLLGSTEYLENHLINKRTITVWDNKNSICVHGCTGKLFGTYPFGAVPHPQAHISTEARHSIWQHVVKENKEFKLSKTSDKTILQNE